MMSLQMTASVLKQTSFIPTYSKVTSLATHTILNSNFASHTSHLRRAQCSLDRIKSAEIQNATLVTCLCLQISTASTVSPLGL